MVVVNIVLWLLVLGLFAIGLRTAYVTGRATANKHWARAIANSWQRLADKTERDERITVVDYHREFSLDALLEEATR